LDLEKGGKRGTREVQKIRREKSISFKIPIIRDESVYYISTDIGG